MGLAALACMAAPKRRGLTFALIGLFACLTLLSSARENKPFAFFDIMEKLNVEQHGTYLTSANLVNLYYTDVGLDLVQKHMAPLEIVKGDASTGVQEWSPRRLRFSYDAAQPTAIMVRQFAFPGFVATRNGKPVDIVREPSTGQMMVGVPAGKGDIEIRLIRLLPERAGLALSCVSALLAGLILAIYASGSRQRSR
jgi:hypothetical protein